MKELRNCNGAVYSHQTQSSLRPSPKSPKSLDCAMQMEINQSADPSKIVWANSVDVWIISFWTQLSDHAVGNAPD